MGSQNRSNADSGWHGIYCTTMSPAGKKQRRLTFFQTYVLHRTHISKGQKSHYPTSGLAISLLFPFFSFLSCLFVIIYSSVSSFLLLFSKGSTLSFSAYTTSNIFELIEIVWATQINQLLCSDPEFWNRSSSAHVVIHKNYMLAPALFSEQCSVGWKHSEQYWPSI